MMSVIRWKGFIGFIVIMIIVFLFWFLFIDYFIERAIEKVGTSIVGAEVDLDKADLTISPLGLELRRLQVTDPDSPMSNAVEIKRIAFSLDGARLLLRKVIIEEMALEGLQINTPRKYPGTVRKKRQKHPPAEEETKEKGFRLPIGALPDIQEILKKEELQSPEQISELRTDIEAAKENWQKRLADLPDEKTFKQYKERIEKVKKTKSKDIAGGLETAGDIIKIQEELSRDLKRIETAQREFTEEMESLRRRVNQLPNAPLEDARRILDKYSLSPKGLANMSQALFGAKVGGYVKTALAWYARLKPLLERRSEEKNGKVVIKPIRGKGVDVRFREHEPLPDFLIRKVNASVRLQAGDMAGTVKNITFDQQTLGKPLDFNFAGEGLKGLRSVKISGSLNHIIPGKNKDILDILITGYQVSNMSISKSERLPVSIQKGSADLQLRSAITGNALDAHLTAGLRSVTIETGKGDDRNAIVNALRSTLSDVSRFSVRADITGTTDDYRVALSSDLDKVLSDALGKQIKQKAREFENKLTSAITEKVRRPMEEASKSFSGLNTIADEVTARLNLGNSILKESNAGIPGGLKLPF